MHIFRTNYLILKSLNYGFLVGWYYYGFILLRLIVLLVFDHSHVESLTNLTIVYLVNLYQFHLRGIQSLDRSFQLLTLVFLFVLDFLLNNLSLFFTNFLFFNGFIHHFYISVFFVLTNWLFLTYCLNLKCLFCLLIRFFLRFVFRLLLLIK